MTTSVRQEKHRERSDESYREDVLLSVLFILFEAEHRTNHGEVSRTRLHMAWGRIIEILEAHKLDMGGYYQDLTNQMWKELDKTIFGLLSYGSVVHGLPMGRWTLCLSLSPGQVKQYIEGMGEIYTKVRGAKELIAAAYYGASQPDLPRVTS